MPKVSPMYFEQKKKMIVNAALNVCRVKTVSSVTMQDIINESGLSQGGIYRFYNNIDEILADLLDYIRKEASIEDQVDRVFQNYEENMIGLEEVIDELFEITKENIKQNLIIYKVEFEYTLLITNFPSRAKMIYTTTKQPEEYEKMNNLIMDMLTREVDANRIHPLISVREFYRYTAVMFEGILKRAITCTCYQKNVKENNDFYYNSDSMFDTMRLTARYLLGLTS